eukprot:NODE_2117_length_2289_cov_8.541166.p1 GENE.NODE_2117_length_2289_cov_8.541166~~NODE_2117_length_2289_cov_8.541166.p1  ORF type:complete len:653 (+),score=151.13 NODE_2117_length_2289_cov_8.541166:225-2183(+)
MHPSSSVQSRLDMNTEASALQIGAMLPAAGKHHATLLTDSRRRMEAPEATSSASPPASDDEDDQPFFRRRSPEQFHRLEVMTSGLTPRLRQTGGQTSAVVNLQDPDLLNGKARRKVDVRVHLPPHGQDPTSVTMTVATMALVSAFRDEIVTQHLGGASALYELRLYDEEEGEPDFDCPPFDLAQRVGCLDVSDLALCLAQPVTDATLVGSGLPMGKSKHTTLLCGSDMPLVPNVGMGPAAETIVAEASVASPHAVIFENGAASSPGAAIACTVQHPRRRTQSSPRGGGEHSSRRLRRRGPASSRAVVRGGFEKLHPVMVRSEREATGCCAEAMAGPTTAEAKGGAANVTQMLSVTLPPSAVPQAGGDEVPAGGTAGVGNTVSICTHSGTTLIEILKQLSEVCACVYDPVNFDFERIGEGHTHQRLDVNMPVQHLQQDTVALAVVRKESPIPDPMRRNQRGRAAGAGKECDAGANLRRPAFPFEFAASLTTEYFVSARIRGSDMRPVDCVLVVGRERLTHRTAAARLEIGCFSGLEKRVGSVFAQYFGKQLALSFFPKRQKQSQAEREILAEQRVQDIREVVQDADDKLGFMVAYRNAKDVGATRRIEYQAQTPTECKEVVARMRVLVTLGERRQHAACSGVRRRSSERTATK